MADTMRSFFSEKFFEGLSQPLLLNPFAASFQPRAGQRSLSTSSPPDGCDPTHPSSLEGERYAPNPVANSGLQAYVSGRFTAVTRRDAQLLELLAPQRPLVAAARGCCGYCFHRSPKSSRHLFKDDAGRIICPLVSYKLAALQTFRRKHPSYKIMRNAQRSFSTSCSSSSYIACKPEKDVRGQERSIDRDLPLAHSSFASEAGSTSSTRDGGSGRNSSSHEGIMHSLEAEYYKKLQESEIAYNNKTSGEVLSYMPVSERIASRSQRPVYNFLTASNGKVSSSSILQCSNNGLKPPFSLLRDKFVIVKRINCESRDKYDEMGSDTEKAASIESFETDSDTSKISSQNSSETNVNITDIVEAILANDDSCFIDISTSSSNANVTTMTGTSSGIENPQSKFNDVLSISSDTQSITGSADSDDSNVLTDKQLGDKSGFECDISGISHKSSQADSRHGKYSQLVNSESHSKAEKGLISELEIQSAVKTDNCTRPVSKIIKNLEYSVFRRLPDRVNESAEDFQFLAIIVRQIVLQRVSDVLKLFSLSSSVCNSDRIMWYIMELIEINFISSRRHIGIDFSHKTYAKDLEHIIFERKADNSSRLNDRAIKQLQITLRAQDIESFSWHEALQNLLDFKLSDTKYLDPAIISEDYCAKKTIDWTGQQLRLMNRIIKNARKIATDSFLMFGLNFENNGNPLSNLHEICHKDTAFTNFDYEKSLIFNSSTELIDLDERIDVKPDLLTVITPSIDGADVDSRVLDTNDNIMTHSKLNVCCVRKILIIASLFSTERDMTTLKVIDFFLDNYEVIIGNSAPYAITNDVGEGRKFNYEIMNRIQTIIESMTEEQEHRDVETVWLTPNMTHVSRAIEDWQYYITEGYRLWRK